jgi:hypothetical protein
VRVQHGADAALRVARAALVGGRLGDDHHATMLCNLERIGQAGNAAANDQEVK